MISSFVLTSRAQIDSQCQTPVTWLGPIGTDTQARGVSEHVTCVLSCRVWTSEMNTVVNFCDSFIFRSLKYVF